MNGALSYLAGLLMPVLPPTRAMGLKRALLQLAGARVGPGVGVCSSARVSLAGPLTIGADTWIGHQVLIAGGDAAVTIGSQVDMAPRVMLVTGKHDRGIGTRAAGAGRSRPITICDGAWNGASAVILGGVTVGERAIVGAGSSVRHDVAAGATVAGVPARPIVALPSTDEEGQSA